MKKKELTQKYEDMWCDGTDWYFITPRVSMELVETDKAIILRDGRSLHWHKQKAAIRYSMLRTIHRDDKERLKRIDEEWVKTLGCFMYEERACATENPKEITDELMQSRIDALIYKPTAEEDLSIML